MSKKLSRKIVKKTKKFHPLGNPNKIYQFTGTIK